MRQRKRHHYRRRWLSVASAGDEKWYIPYNFRQQRKKGCSMQAIEYTLWVNQP